MPDRQARCDQRLRRCDRLAEMAMHLTEAAYTQALRDAQPPPERPRPAPGALPAYMPPATKAAYDRTLASNFFQEFSRCARQAILLEARLDSLTYEQAPALPALSPRTRHQHAACPEAPAQPRQPSDQTRLDRECLEDEFPDANLADPDEALQAITENLHTTIAKTRAAGLDFPCNADADPPPRRPDTPSCPAVPAGTQTQARPTASPTRSARR